MKHDKYYFDRDHFINLLWQNKFRHVGPQTFLFEDSTDVMMIFIADDTISYIFDGAGVIPSARHAKTLIIPDNKNYYDIFQEIIVNF